MRHTDGGRAVSNRASIRGLLNPHAFRISRLAGPGSGSGGGDMRLGGFAALFVPYCRWTQIVFVPTCSNPSLLNSLFEFFSSLFL